MSKVKVEKIVMGMYQTNCYYAYLEDSKDIIVVDPADSGEYLFDLFTEKGFKVSAILLTHGHFDHIYGVKALKELSGAKVYAFSDENRLLSDEDLNCSVSLSGRSVRLEADTLLSDGEMITLAGMDISVIHTPGHTEGSASFYIKEEGLLFSGDTLFSGSVGRSDLPTGNGRTLINSIKDKLMVLPPDVRVFPGHGDETTIGFERKYNPFL